MKRPGDTTNTTNTHTLRPTIAPDPQGSEAVRSALHPRACPDCFLTIGGLKCNAAVAVVAADGDEPESKLLSSVCALHDMPNFAATETPLRADLNGRDFAALGPQAQSA